MYYNIYNLTEEIIHTIRYVIRVITKTNKEAYLVVYFWTNDENSEYILFCTASKKRRIEQEIENKDMFYRSAYTTDDIKYISICKYNSADIDSIFNMEGWLLWVKFMHLKLNLLIK